MSIIKRILQKYVYQDWNIAIAERNDDLSLKNIRWMKHNYKDRWFADPFIIDDKRRNLYMRGILSWDDDPKVFRELAQGAQVRLRGKWDLFRLMEYCRPPSGRGAR